jgi:hypothetical protein
MAKSMSQGAKMAGKTGPLRSPMAGHLAGGKQSPKLNPSIAANTTTPGIAKASAPIQSPMNKGAIVRYSR